MEKTESLYIKQDRKFADGVTIWQICCLTGVWLRRKNCLDILRIFRSSMKKKQFNQEGDYFEVYFSVI